MSPKRSLPDHLIQEWHPAKNFPIDLGGISYASNRQAWWQCSLGHEWEARISSRSTANASCPYCSNSRVWKGFNDLATTYPKVAETWHPIKNGSLTPDAVIAGSSKKVWWLDKCDHEWEASIEHRIKAKFCPVCNNKIILEGFNDLKTLRPDLFAEWHHIRNSIPATKIGIGSSKKIWWLDNHGHEWEARVYSRTNGNGCPYCRNLKVLEGFNDLATLCPALATQWHPSLNGKYSPKNVTAGSAKPAWWICEKGHEWKASIESRFHNQTGCPYCTNNKLLPGFNDLATVHPMIAASWCYAKNLGLNPTDVISGSNKKFWWICPKSHKWKTSVAKRINGSGCPTCSNKTILLGFNDLATLMPTLATQWHPLKNNGLTPTDVGAGANKRIWWVCEKGHEWEAVLYNRAWGKGCPSCASGTSVSKGEKAVATYIESLGLKIKTSVRSIIKGELDIYVPDKKIAIEFNGLYWHSEKFLSNTYHEEKYKNCKEQGIRLIQVWADDWEHHEELVKQMLISSLGKKREQVSETFVKEISEHDAKPFLERNHLDGYTDGSIKVGLEDKITGELVSVMVLDRVPERKRKTLNLLRFASSIHSPTGFAQLLHHIETTYTPELIVTYADNCVDNGSLYKENGFKESEEKTPDYMYVVRNRREHKEEYTIERFKTDPTLKYEDGLNELELADLNGLNRIWDAGKTKWKRHVIDDYTERLMKDL